MNTISSLAYDEKSKDSGKRNSFLDCATPFAKDTRLKRTVWQSVKNLVSSPGDRNASQQYPNHHDHNETKPDDEPILTKTVRSMSSPVNKDTVSKKRAVSTRQSILQKKHGRQHASVRDVRVTFMEPSPVPRFRNVAPPPPRTPPLLQIAVPKPPSRSISERDTNAMLASRSQDTTDDSPLGWKLSRRLCFRPPHYHGQKLTFSLLNLVSDDHIVVYKFLTRNAATNTTTAGKKLTERYFVRPSSGRIDTSSGQIITLILNRTPVQCQDEMDKDRILVRWVAVQRHTTIYTWVKSLSDATRRKWLEMLVEKWPGQVIVRETRLKIRFL